MDSLASNPAMELLDQLAEIPFAQRARFLDEKCSDPDTRSEVESLLAALDDAGEFLDERRKNHESVEPHVPGTHIGAYELIEMIGEGGFARVFRARQSRPVRREVALKLVKLGMDTRAVIARFEQERQALAMMDHPSIAAVYDAGATDTGRPYFVMELVRGPRITRFCEDSSLDIRARVKLFIDVCSAVQHAHTKGILHRDLKPSNVLVTTVDDHPLPKVIDFGIAKAVQEKLTDLTLVTQEQQLLGTPQYMSPEQARSGGADVDTRSDIYSLGAVLYELLAGVSPLEAPSGSGSAFEQIQKLTGPDEIPRPSARAAPDRARDLRGELDWIIGKCMEKDRSRRYDSAAALGSDLRAYLDFRPITAAPPTLAYQTRKFVRRNSAAVVAGGVILATVIAGAIVSGVMAYRAIRAERLAQSRLQDAQNANKSLTAVNEFLTEDLIGAADPAITRGRELTVREALDNASARIAGKFAGSPLIDANLRNSVALAYWKIGHADKGLPHAKQALDQRQAVLGNDHPDTIRALNAYATLLERSGRLNEASAKFSEALERSRRALGEDAALTAQLLHNYATSLMSLGRLSEAAPLLRRSWEQRRRILGQDHTDTLSSQALYARAIQLSGRPGDAEPIFRDALDRSRRTLGTDHPLTISLLNFQAVVLKDMGRLSDAAQMQKECLELRVRVLGEDHPESLASLANYADILHAQGLDAQAEPLSKSAMERHLRVLGPDHADTITSMNNYAEVLRKLNRSAEAEPFARQAMENHRRVAGPDHPTSLILLSNYAGLLRSLGKYEEAEACFKESLERGRRVRGSDHPQTLLAMNNYASMLRSMKRDSEAEPLFAELYDLAPQAQMPARTAAMLMMNYGPCLVRLGKYAEARAPLVEAHRRLKETNQNDGARMADVLDALVIACEKTGLGDEASRWRAERAAILLPRAGTQPATSPSAQLRQ